MFLRAKVSSSSTVLWFEIVVMILSFAGLNASQSTITTSPYLPGNILASGYSGLKLTTQFVDQNSYIECYWRFQSQYVIFSNTVVCAKVTLSGLQATCVRDNNLTTTSLVVTYPLNTTNNPANFLLQCRSRSSITETISSIVIVIRGNFC